LTPGEVRTALTAIERRLRSILDGTASQVLSEAAAQADASYARYVALIRQRDPDAQWGYRVERERPLRFRRVDVRDGHYEVDLFCDIRYADPASGPTYQNVGMRVWSLDPAVIFRPELDAPGLEEWMNSLGRRVMLRYHFDSADPKQSGPTFHLQAGGNGLDEEFCWLHEAVSVPRLAHPPVDLMLAVEIVAMNFFADAGLKGMSDPTVLGALRASQSELLEGWFRTCLAAVQSGRSVLGTVWKH
jgi:hypothetical protein